MQAEAVEHARSVGVAMGSRAQGNVFGYTTDEAKAEACSEFIGLTVNTCYNRTGPRGWEIQARPDPPPEEETEV